MTNQKELTVRQIKTMYKEASLLSGENIYFTTKEILLSLENEDEKELIYKCIEAYKTMKNLKAQIKRKQIKYNRLELENSKNTAGIQ